jgi:hypothetical protein
MYISQPKRNILRSCWSAVSVIDTAIEVGKSVETKMSTSLLSAPISLVPAMLCYVLQKDQHNMILPKAR